MSEEKRLVKFIKMQGQVFQFEPPLSEVSLLECVGQSNLRLQNLPKKCIFFPSNRVNSIFRKKVGVS